MVRQIIFRRAGSLIQQWLNRRIGTVLGPLQKGRATPLPAKRHPKAAAAVTGEVIEQRGVTSTWVKRIFLVMYDGEPRLAVRFKDGYTCVYPNTNERDYRYMLKAASKGEHVWAALYTRGKVPISL